MRTTLPLSAGLALLLAALFVPARLSQAADTLPSIDKRFAKADVTEEPDFQRHVMPVLGRLGCNGRACHGSFQGRGDFQLSLFGYDFKVDHDALLVKQDEMRVNVENPDESLIIAKPTDEDMHEGGKRYDRGSWQHHVFRRWIQSGAKFDQKEVQVLSRLEITPSEILFNKAGEKVQLKVIAVWPDGVREDVTPLCRYQSNSDQVAKIDQDGNVTATKPGDTHLVVYYDNAVVPVPVLRPVTDKVGAKYPKVATPTKVDQLVVQKLRKLGVVPSEVSNDAEFLRRVSLDMTGSLPTPQQIEKFLSSKSPNKRSEKIDELLKSPAYAAWWTTKLCDFTGNNDFQLNNVLPAQRGRTNRASQDWYNWIYKRVADNTPYDELVAGIVTATSRKPGQSYADYCKEMSEIYRTDAKKEFADHPSMPYYWARRDFRQIEPRTINFAYAFMGIRIQCAQCHKHPFDQWSKDDFAQFTKFFGQVQLSNNQPRNSKDKEEYDKIVKALGVGQGKKKGNQLRRELGKFLSEGKVVPFPEIVVSKTGVQNGRKNNKKNKNAKPRQVTATLLGGETLNLADYDDARQPLMDWLRAKDNPYFARAFVNRVWAAYFNVGIVEPADDMSLANPPSNKALLDYLAQGFIEHQFDMKWLHREIANSRTYQLSWRPNETNKMDEINFSHAIPRRLPAEVTYDALQQATASDAKALAMHTDITGRAIAIPGSNGQNRNRGNNAAAYALTVFGRSVRESNCDCDRSSEASLLQTVFLQNDNQMLQMIDGRNDGWIGQVSQQLNPKRQQQPANPRANNKVPPNFKQQVARIQKQIKNFKKAGNEQQAKRLEARLAAYKKRFVAAKPTKPVEKKVEETTKPVDTTALVKQAYLRTLSRYPDARELERSQKHLAEADNPIDGLRGLLWALLNTKEFIVNH